MIGRNDQERTKAELIAELRELRSMVPQLERMSRQYRESEKLQSALYAIANLASASEDMDHFYEALHRIVGQLMYAKNFYVALLEEETQKVNFPYFVDEFDTKGPYTIPVETLNRGLTAYVLRTGDPLLGSRSKLQRLMDQGELEVAGTLPVDWLGVPLKNGDRIVGVLVVQSYSEANRYHEREKELLIFVSQHIVTALHHKQAWESLEANVLQRTRELENANRVLRKEIGDRKQAERLQTVLVSVAELANQSLGLEHFFADLHPLLSGLVFAENFSVALYDREEGLLRFPYWSDRRRPGPPARPKARGFNEYVLNHKRPVLLDPKAIRQLIQKGEVVPLGELPGYWLGVPLMKQETVAGVLAVSNYHPEKPLLAKDLNLLTVVSHHLANALERKRAEAALVQANLQLEKRVRERTQELFEANRTLQQQIESRKEIEQKLIYDALHDALTGLPNRNLFMERLVRAIGRKQRDRNFEFAVLYLDLDRFKIVNDSLGHMVGDQLLKEVSARIQGCMRESDMVARLGGDEFALLLENISGEEEARGIAGRISRSLDKPFELGQQTVFSSTSIGIAMSHERYSKPEDLLRDSDAAMYRAKEKGRHRFEVFNEHMHREVMTKMVIENQLRQALEKEALEVVYQPMVDLETQRVVGFEALVRWNHPDHGLLDPSEFVPIAAETDLIMNLDWCVLQRVCSHAKHWKKLGMEGRTPDGRTPEGRTPEGRTPGGRTPVIHMNLSPQHFSRKGFVQRLRATLDEYDFPYEALRLEVSELALMGQHANFNQILRELQQVGIKVVPDDFGARSSSFGYLHRYEMDMLKIDRTLIDDLPDSVETESIVKTVVVLANSLNMKVVAEGIETEAQWQKMKQIGCHVGQGYYISKPLSQEHAESFCRWDALV